MNIRSIADRQTACEIGLMIPAKTRATMKAPITASTKVNPALEAVTPLEPERVHASPPASRSRLDCPKMVHLSTILHRFTAEIIL